MKTNILHPVRLLRNKLQSIQAEPTRVISGFTFGVFMATTPFIGLKWVLALPVVWIMKWNKMACMLGILQVNYLTGPFFYGLAFMIGKQVCGMDGALAMPEHFNLRSMAAFITGNAEVFIALLAGGALLGIPLCIASYFLVRALYSKPLKIAAT